MRWIALAAAGLVALASCGAPSGLAPKTYARQACGAVAAFEGTLSPQAAAYAKAVTAAKGDPSQLKTATVTFLQQQVVGSSMLVIALQRIERPAGTGGAAVRNAMVTAAQSAQETFQNQATTVAATSPTDRAGFFGILDGAQKQVQAAGQSLAAGLESVAKYGDQRLNDAFAADATCSGLAGSGAPTS